MMQIGLVPRTRSSHKFAGHSDANFGLKSDTTGIALLVSLSISEVRTRAPTLRKTIRRCGCRATPISIGPSPLSATSGSALSMPSRARKNRSSTTRARRQRILMSKLSAIRSSKADTIATARLSVETSGEGFFEITAEVTRFLEQIGARDGVILIYLRHTSASLVIQENADPDVRKDLVTAISLLALAYAVCVIDEVTPDS